MKAPERSDLLIFGPLLRLGSFHPCHFSSADIGRWEEPLDDDAGVWVLAVAHVGFRLFTVAVWFLVGVDDAHVAEREGG